MRSNFLFKVTFLILSAMVCIIFLNSCNKITDYRETKKKEEQRKKEQESKELQKMLNGMKESSYRKEATLLAIKYKIEEDKVFNLLVETQGSSLESMIKATLESKSITKSRLNSLAEKYNIPIEMLASILIDYYSMQACDH